MNGKQVQKPRASKLIASENEIKLTAKLIRGRIASALASGDSQAINKAFERARQEMRDSAARHLDSIEQMTLTMIVEPIHKTKRNYHRSPKKNVSNQ